MDYVEIARFDSRLEAETIGHALDQYGIPFQVHSQVAAIFGPLPGGAGLHVPADRAGEAEELLHCAVQPHAEPGDAAPDGSEPNVPSEGGERNNEPGER